MMYYLTAAGQFANTVLSKFQQLHNTDDFGSYCLYDRNRVKPQLNHWELKKYN